MNYIWAGIMLVSVISGICTGRIQQVSDAAFDGAGQAIDLCITLVGVMMLWCGLMRIAERAGVTTALCRVLAPVLRVLFPGLDPRSEAASAISMNMVANLLGLGNAATPLGLKAMKCLAAENPRHPAASRHMITFVILNTSSIQIVPTTIAAMRSKYGAASPMDIMPAIWISSVLSLAVGLAVNFFCSLKEARP